MDALMIGVAGLIGVAAITPGPNNLIVMRVGSRSGFTGAFPAIAGIVGGGLAMLLLAMVGADVVFAAEPRLYSIITVAGTVYLSVLGARLVIGSFRNAEAHAWTTDAGLPVGALALFGFQFLNPKSWVMVLTVTSAVHGAAGASRTFWSLAALFAVIPTFCLALWCLFGVLMSSWVDRAVGRRWLDRIMGTLLIGSALVLISVPLDGPRVP